MTRPSLLLSLVQASAALQRACLAAIDADQPELAAAIRTSGAAIAAHISSAVRAERNTVETAS